MLQAPLFLLLACSLLGCISSVSSFSTRSSIGPIPGNAAKNNSRAAPRPATKSGATTTTAEGPSLGKVESAAVKRFTISYDKLCKSCPTRLEPRVDTLTEMILGLPDGERAQLMSAVAGRLEERESGLVNGDGDAPRGLRSSRDVYDYQTAGAADESERRKEEMQANNASYDAAAAKTDIDGGATDDEEEIDVVDAKLLKKMQKARAKFDTHKRNLAKARRLLAVTNALLSRDEHRSEPTIYTVQNPADNAWYHDVDELRKLKRGELKMERLKLAAQRAKYESKVAKGRLKLYRASVALMDHVK